MSLLGDPTFDAVTRTFPGVYAGVVTNVEDPQQAGRVKVQVPSIFVGDDVWARPCFGYGHFFVPVVGDHAWVAFEGGDPHAPVWLGIWYPSGALPELAAGGTPVPTQRLLRTRSGHTLTFDDTEGSESVRIQHAQGSYVELSPSAVTIHCEQPLTIDAPGQEIKVQAASLDVSEA